MQPVGLPLALLDLRLSIPGQLAQRPDRLGRHEARPQQPSFQQLTEPLGILDVGLATGKVLDMLSVDQQQLEVVLKYRPHRLPVHARGLHRHLRHAVRLQPIAQHQQPADHRRELTNLRASLAITSGHPHTRGHLRLMHIQRRRALDDHIHLRPPRSRPTATVVRQEPPKQTSLKSVLKATVPGSGGGTHAKLITGSQAAFGRRRPDHPPFSPAPGRRGGEGS